MGRLQRVSLIKNYSGLNLLLKKSGYLRPFCMLTAWSTLFVFMVLLKQRKSFRLTGGAFSLFLLLLFNNCQGRRWKWWFVRDDELDGLFLPFLLFFMHSIKAQFSLKDARGRWVPKPGGSGADLQRDLRCFVLYYGVGVAQWGKEMSGNHLLRFCKAKNAMIKNECFLNLI